MIIAEVLIHAPVRQFSHNRSVNIVEIFPAIKDVTNLVIDAARAALQSQKATVDEKSLSSTHTIVADGILTLAVLEVPVSELFPGITTDKESKKNFKTARANAEALILQSRDYIEVKAKQTAKGLHPVFRVEPNSQREKPVWIDAKDENIIVVTKPEIVEVAERWLPILHNLNNHKGPGHSDTLSCAVNQKPLTIQAPGIALTTTASVEQRKEQQLIGLVTSVNDRSKICELEANNTSGKAGRREVIFVETQRNDLLQAQLARQLITIQVAPISASKHRFSLKSVQPYQDDIDLLKG